ncbi:hypothetical protein U14_01602 [Candidatus Moduliflexus flocculans]|uniref:Uncharacterized protein n=1 Tax=Candidatus Moduliflexus flocculans TaxID=1499966 RepID=A0A0S6VW11_9BACT|nr:hypothetical protein U14_01602 [Candidatus Moduliflexus flocculans]
MLMYPTLRYQNGGAEINANDGICVPALYVIGEADIHTAQRAKRDVEKAPCADDSAGLHAGSSQRQTSD